MRVSVLDRGRAVLAACACVGALAADAIAHPGRGIAVAADGTVYVADAVRSVVWRIKPDGAVEAAARDLHAHWLCVGPGGEVYAEHVEYRASDGAWLRGLYVIEPGGRKRTIVEPSAGPDGFDSQAFAVDAIGTLWYFDESEQALKSRMADGLVRRHAGIPPGAGEERALVSSLAVAEDGALTFTRGRDVLRMDALGHVSVVATISREEPTEAVMEGAHEWGCWGVCVEPGGDALVGDPAGRRIVRVGVDGTVATRASFEAPWFPTGVAAREGDTYVLEHGTSSSVPNMGPRVRVISRDGASRVLATIP